MRIFYIVAVKEPDDENFKNILSPSLTTDQLNRTVLVYQGEGILEKYKKGIDILIERFSFQDDDAVVFIHNDVQIKDPLFEGKINIVFSKRPDIGLIGVYGTTHFGEHCSWWTYERERCARGSIIQRYPNKQTYVMTDRKGFFDNIVVIDGCVMIEIGKLAKMKLFDSETFTGYHQYDSSHCLDVLEKTDYKIAVADIQVFHDSPGVMSNFDKWYESVKIHKERIKSKGLTFPVSIESFKK